MEKEITGIVQPWLGTAFWGWRMDKRACFDLLDFFYQEGFRHVDAATNYPINKNPEHFRLAENILHEWISAHGVSDLSICQKIGSVNNLGGPEHVLTPSFLMLSAAYYKHKFGSNLHVLMWHWDKRLGKASIKSSLQTMLQLMAEEGWDIGFSGLDHPSIHADILFELSSDLTPYLQIKHNLFHSAYEHYKPFWGRARFVVYGMAAGGLKFGESPMRTFSLRGGKPDRYRGALRDLQRYLKKVFPGRDFTFYELSMIYVFHLPDLAGFILGPSSVEQLKQGLLSWQRICSGEGEDLYKALLSWKENRIL